MDSLSIESAGEMEERFAVTAATGALGPVLRKLAALLGDEYKLQEGTRRGIESIKSDLDPVHRLLGKLWWREDLDVACKDWMTEARELSYDMEDGIDSFTLGLERGNDGSFIQQTATDIPFKGFVERVKDVSQRCGEMQKIGNSTCNSSKLTTDPRALFLHKDASELVGMEEKKEELIKWMEEHKMVCIVGSAGMGKTTLADLVYHTIGHEFQCRAFVSVHPSPNMTEILGTILRQVTEGGTISAGSGPEPAGEQNMINDVSISLSEKRGTEPAAEQHDFIKGISTFLSDKRYMAIIDDIWHWEDWEVIRKALPKNNLRCNLIMTTRVRSIAKKCSTEEGARVYELYFGRAEAASLSAMRLSKSVEGTNAKVLATKIADMCGGPTFGFCPLAVICLSSAWADRQQGGGDGEWDTWASHVLDDGFLSTPALKPLVQSLCLGFDDLPVQLRTCLIYCTVYPLGYRVDRGWLVRKWIAEGFASRVEVAEGYFDKLISRNLLQPGLPRVQLIMRAFLMCKAKEDNLIAYYDGPGASSHGKQIRRLSLTTDCYPHEDVLLSHARSLVVCGNECQLDGAPFKVFKNLRLLEIKSSRVQNSHLVDICGLTWLRYLGLNDCRQITELPREIGKLQNLETLDMAGTHISNLPIEIGKLQHLETLDVSCTDVAELPRWIEILQSLKTLNVSCTKITELPREIKNLGRLEILDISRTRVTEFPNKEIRKLKHLRTLDIRGTKVRELSFSIDMNQLLSVVVRTDGFYCKEVKSLLCVISSSGGEEVISCSDQAKSREYVSIFVLFTHFSPKFEVRPIAMLRVAGRYMKVPQWVKQDLRNVCSLDIRLCKLVEQDLEFLKTQMPNLQALALRLEVLPWEPVAITRGGFRKLQTFYVDCRLPRVITFEEGAMPMLKHLEFKFYTGAATSQNYCMGIEHLDSLEKVVFRCSKNYTSDGPGIRATINAVRKEVGKHTKKGITIWVDDAIVSCDIEREVKTPGIIARRKSQLTAIEKRAQLQRNKYHGRGGI